MSRPAARLVAGVDEVGRGCLAGPVHAAAVVLRSRRGLAGLDDSKSLTAARREALATRIRARAVAWAVASANLEEIERLNILHASLLAMRRAVEALGLVPDEVWVDGNQRPPLDGTVRLFPGGDAQHPCIMAASILAKVTRDEEMARLDAAYPGYGFSRHKGYATRAHRAALRALGPCAIHRRYFTPVSQLELELDPSETQVPAP